MAHRPKTSQAEGAGSAISHVDTRAVSEEPLALMHVGTQTVSQSEGRTSFQRDSPDAMAVIGDEVPVDSRVFSMASLVFDHMLASGMKGNSEKEFGVDTCTKVLFEHFYSALHPARFRAVQTDERSVIALISLRAYSDAQYLQDDCLTVSNKSPAGVLTNLPAPCRAVLSKWISRAAGHGVRDQYKSFANILFAGRHLADLDVALLGQHPGIMKDLLHREQDN